MILLEYRYIVWLHAACARVIVTHHLLRATYKHTTDAIVQYTLTSASYRIQIVSSSTLHRFVTMQRQFYFTANRKTRTLCLAQIKYCTLFTLFLCLALWLLVKHTNRFIIEREAKNDCCSHVHFSFDHRKTYAMGFVLYQWHAKMKLLSLIVCMKKAFSLYVRTFRVSNSHRYTKQPDEKIPNCQQRSQLKLLSHQSVTFPSLKF